MSRRPDFFIIGAPKSGTTAMDDYLRRHPQIYMAVKELHYFGSDLAYNRRRPSEADYRSAFAGVKNERRVGESSVGYLYSARAPHEIIEFSPTAQIVIMLRHPVDFIVAQHAEQLFRDQEDIVDLGLAIAAEPDRAALRRLPPECEVPYSLRYTWLARYADHVGRYLDVFGRDRVHVILFDDFVRDTPGTYARLLEFLGCDAGFQPEFRVVNARKTVRSRRFQKLVRTPPQVLRRAARRMMPLTLRSRMRQGLYRLNARPVERPHVAEGLRARLLAEINPQTERLARLIDRDLSAWLV